MTELIAPHPFGVQITRDALIEKFSGCRQWEDRYRQLILLGKQLPALSDMEKSVIPELSGCENRVWLGHQQLADGRLHFYGDSEGRIVRGLLAVLLTAVEGCRVEELRQLEPRELFRQLGLEDQLSASRAMGLTVLINAVKAAGCG